MQRILRRFLSGAAALLLAALGWAADTQAPIDWDRARALFQKRQQGEMLSAADQAYLARAQAARQRGEGPGAGPSAMAALTPEERQRAQQIMQKQRAGETLSDEERAFVQSVRAKMGQSPRGGPPQPGGGAPMPEPRDKLGLTPLNEMTADARYKGEDGGLYGAGRNEPPATHLKAALATAARIVPLDAAGKPSPSGKIALLSVGMSNTTQEFSRFVELARSDPAKAPAVVLVDGAQGGQAAAQWITAPDNRVWQTVDSRLQAAGVTPAQVQVVWLKQANIRPTEPFPAHALKLESDIAAILEMLVKRFPNLRLAYLSSRIYAGYATTPLNPEPFAYESAFAVRRLIRRQIDGDAAVNGDPSRGEVRAPLLLWGPYLWADGLTARRSDGLVWERGDLREDGTHPSATTGRDKVARMLLAFLKTDPTARVWFCGASPAAAK
jgi:hypothetical protein